MRVARLAGICAALTAVACGSSVPPRVVPHAMASEAAWSPMIITPGKALDGGAWDEIALNGGEVIRLETDANIMVGERVRTGASFAETWTMSAAKDGVAIVRPSAAAVALLFARGAVARAHAARGFEPGYAWFELEARAITWAEGPLHAPFPAVAPAERLDIEGFAALDRALSNGV